MHTEKVPHARVLLIVAENSLHATIPTARKPSSTRVCIGTGVQAGSLVFSPTSRRAVGSLGSRITTVTDPGAPLSLHPQDQTFVNLEMWRLSSRDP